MSQENRVSVLERLGLNSLKNRYLATAILISITLMFAAYFGWHYVDRKSREQLQSLINRTEASHALSDVVFQIHGIEKSLLEFIADPNDQNVENINKNFILFDSSAERLRKNVWVNDDDTISSIVLSILQDKQNLQTEVKHLVSLRKNESAWVPAMTIMQDEMLQDNLQLVAIIDGLLLEAEEDVESDEGIELFTLLHEIRYSWQKLISEFRLYVSNAFGIFTPDRAFGMNSRKANINLYIENTENLINEYREQARDIDNPSAVELMKWFNRWVYAYHQVSQPLEGKHWRKDHVLFNENIEPLFNHLLQRTSSLDLELSVESARNIDELTILAHELLNFVIIVAIMLTASSLIGYFIFNQSILLPIKNLGRALKLEAADKFIDPSRIIVSRAKEFENLRAAFVDMRDQIHIRQSNLDHMAHHDALTELPNRFLLRDRLERAITRARRDKNNVALIFLDLDRFKKINDSLGHDVGDQLLIRVAKRLLGSVRGTDTVSRLGGDEFAIVVESVTVDQVANMASKILAEFIEPFKIDSHELFVTTSIGIALGPTDDNDVDALIKDADIAMYHAKDLGRNTYKFYSSDMAARVAEHMALENQLHHALDENQFVQVYQPIVDMKTEKIIGVESLLRWDHPEDGIIVPDRFLGIAEDTGLIRPITQWVMIEACKQLIRFKESGYPEVSVSVNLSGSLLRTNSILDIVINALDQTKVDHRGLIMEVTEDTLLEDLQDSERSLRTLKEMGVRIALDDFGTGQSSLSHLRMNPIDIVKIDKSFIRDIPGDPKDMELVDAVIAMAHKLKMRVVAEGVETEEQLEFLRWHNCDSIQGYYFSKPCGGDEILTKLKKNSIRLVS